MVIGLTCHHVVFDKAIDTANNEEIGQPDGQSSSSESCNDIIGRTVEAQYDEDVDVALVRLHAQTRYLAEIQDLGLVAGVGPHPAKNDPVRKRGRTTGLTGGFVDDISIDGDILNPDRTVKRHYKRAIQIQANPDPGAPGPTDFTRGGDSGAAYVNAAGEVIGIHFSGAPGTGFSWGTPIENIIDKFNGVPIAGGPTIPAARRVPLVVASAAAVDDVRTVPAAMTADEQAARALITLGEARQLEEELRKASPRGAWYADLYRRHGHESTFLTSRDTIDSRCALSLNYCSGRGTAASTGPGPTTACPFGVAASLATRCPFGLPVRNTGSARSAICHSDSVDHARGRDRQRRERSRRACPAVTRGYRQFSQEAQTPGFPGPNGSTRSTRRKQADLVSIALSG